MPAATEKGIAHLTKNSPSREHHAGDHGCPFAPFVYLRGNEIKRMWREYSLSSYSNPLEFIRAQEEKRKLRYTAALNSGIVLSLAFGDHGLSLADASGIVHRASFRRNRHGSLIFDILFSSGAIESVNLAREQISLLPFPPSAKKR